MGYTGHKCDQSGIYTPSCGCKQIALSKGDTFPPCGQHGGVTWTLTQATH